MIAISIAKGGCGKSTTAANLAAVWGREGRRVLVLDLDAAFSVTRMFGCAPSDAPGTVLDLLTGGELRALRDVVPGVDLVPACRELAGVELSLAGEVGRERFLTRALEGRLGGYDVALIDTAPALGLLTVNALVAADEVLAPVAMSDPGALQGLAETRAAAVRVRERLGGSGLLPVLAARTKVDARRVTYAAVSDALDRLGVPITAASVPLSAAFDNAATAGRPLALARPDSAGAIAYWRLTSELTQARDLKAAA